MLEIEQRKGTDWFYWIAGLSILNTLITLFKGDWVLIIGLGSTQFVDAFLNYGEFNFIGLIINLFIAGLFILLGYLANRGSKISLILGMILYGLDGLLFILDKDWLSIGFHIFVLFSIFKAFYLIKGEEE